MGGDIFGELKIINLLKFLIGTGTGIYFLLIPFNFNGKIDTVLFYYLKVLVNRYIFILEPFMIVCIIISAFLSIFGLFCKKNNIFKNQLINNLFRVSPFYVFSRIIAVIFSILIYFKIGFIYELGNSILILAIELSIIVPLMFFFQTFILEFGAMEFLGEFFGKIFKLLFKVSEISSTSIISAWVGPGNVGIMGTSDLYNKGFYTKKEAAIISSQFTTASMGWVVIVASVLDVVEYLGWIILGLIIISILIGIICSRIPPISLYEDTYVDGSYKYKHLEEKSGNIFKRALLNAQNRADKVKLENFTSKIEKMAFYIFSLVPTIVFWGTFSLILAKYTPFLIWISKPLEIILNIFNIKEASLVSSSIMSGLFDNYLPVMFGQEIMDSSARLIVAITSIISIVYLSETAILLISTKLIKNLLHVIIIFFERTYIALPFIIMFVRLII